MNDFDTYLSPFTWRYGSDEMRRIWSETHKRQTWRRIWVALAEVQAEFSLVQHEQVENLRTRQSEIDIQHALEIEAEIHHDLMAELKVFAEQAPLGGGILHLGATSMDIEDNADVLRIRQSLEIIIETLRELLLRFADKISTYAGLPLMAYTHLQPAEPSTLGYRLALYAQDLLIDWEAIGRARRGLKGKGFKGAVGTGAAYAELIGIDNLDAFEARLSAKLGLPFYPVTSQVYPRKQDYAVIGALAGLGGSLYKFAFDLRLLQSPSLGELSEPFGKKQVGSSAMPFKRNPINAEKVDSLARMLAQMPRVAWDNAAHSLLERTLDDSANRRTLLPEAFLITDELLRVSKKIIEGLAVNESAINHNLDVYGPFAAIEKILMALSKAGADRQEMHELLRGHAMSAWAEVQAGRPNPLHARIRGDEQLLGYMTAEELSQLMDARQHVGNAPQKAVKMSDEIRTLVLR
jgi:adenylosuccinate lyase